MPVRVSMFAWPASAEIHTLVRGALSGGDIGCRVQDIFLFYTKDLGPGVLPDAFCMRALNKNQP